MNDTCLAINNEGRLVFDYYHEDIDQLDGANVFNGQNSVLWNNVRLAFASEIKTLYQQLRSSGKLTYDVLCDRFITQGSDMWSESIYNEDSDFKYVSMLRSDNDASNLYQIRGDGEQHFKYFVKNRLDYCDSKWYASSYANDYVSLRIYTPTTENLVVPPDADITVTPFSNMYAGVRYKANGTLQQTRATKNTPVTFTAPNETFNDTETAIYGASNLSSLGDLAPLYCGSINVSNATKLITLKIGDSTVGYSNPNLTELSIGTNRLLKNLDVRNCPNLTDPLALVNCPNIENIYAEGSGITGVELPDNGYLKVIHLPSSVRNLTLKNQIYITDFSIESAANIKTLWIENCPTVNAKSLLDSCTSLERLRLVGVNWTFADTTYLHSLIQQGYGGLDETGANISNAFISGTCYIPSLTGAEMAEIKTAFPYLEVTYDTLTATVYFMSEDGQTQYTTATSVNGASVTYSGTTPTKAQTAQYTFTFDGWSSIIGGSLKPNILNNVETDRYVYAHFANTTRTYTVRFYNGTTLLETVNDVPYGTDATYSGSEPVRSSNNSISWEFSGWNPSPANIQGDTDCYAQFVYTGAITDSWDVISQHSTNGDAANYYSVGDIKAIHLQGTMGTVSLNTDVCVYILGFNHNSSLEGSGITFGGFKDINDLTDIALVDGYYNTQLTDGTKAFNANHWGFGNSGGWAGCDMRYDILGSTNQAPANYGSAPSSASSRAGNNPTSTCASSPVPNTLMSCLPSDLRAKMKPITKYTDNSGNKSNYSGNVKSTTDYLPLLSEYEVTGVRTFANEYEQNKQLQYAYFSSGNSRAKYKYGDKSIACEWRLRSPRCENAYGFCTVYSANGGMHWDDPRASIGVAPLFLI